jgi:Helicase conserved C-terminal domain/PLD-like domain/Type III restriction enzyme, res subunit
MATERRDASDLFIVDNSDSDWKVMSYLADWCEFSSAMDIATGYFEIGALLGLEEKWQEVDKIRILFGDEVTKRTKRIITQGIVRLSQMLDDSIEAEKDKNDFLIGVPAIVDAIRSNKIVFRVYAKDKFHAKAYITHGRKAVIGSFALVGSSNFTHPGLTDNVELNVKISGAEVRLLQEWYERHWDLAEEVTPEILRTFERHTEPRKPFTIWLKALDEYFRGKELDPDAWDEEKSLVFKVLDKYQQDAYRNLLKIADQNGCAFLCDGVGLGKTYVGLMLIERLVFKDAKQVVLFAPKAAREDVWEPVLKKYLSEVFSSFVNLVVYNHTDLQREGKWPREMRQTIRDADAVIIDEAHNFRNQGLKGEGVKGPSRYRKLQEYLHASERPKQLFFLTATPINNSLHDFRHIVELHTEGVDNYFSSSLGIHNLRAHFIRLEKRILKRLSSTDQLELLTSEQIDEAEEQFHNDRLFNALVVQRSRSYVKESQKLHGGNDALFPERGLPKVAAYNLKATYGNLLEQVRKAFSKKNPLFTLGIYYPLSYWIGDEEDETKKSFEEGRQKQVVTLIRTLFLKRFESSATAFESSCYRLLQKLYAWVKKHAESDHDLRRLAKWDIKHGDLIGVIKDHQVELWPDDSTEDQVEEFLTEDILNAIDKLKPEEFKIDDIIDDTLDDMNQIAEFLQEVAKVTPENDDKLKALKKLLSKNKDIEDQKVIIFTEFSDTARYLERELKGNGIEGVERIDGSSNQKHRSDTIKRFSPYYNETCTADIEKRGKKEIRVLVSTDVLAEGLNLQDATALVNYDLHWNPVRLMQRIGRIDRRFDPEVEKTIIRDHPEQAKFRGKVTYWNFLPPDELDDLLKLYRTVSTKVVVISKTLGIEGQTLLTPEDQYEQIKELNEKYEGQQTETEKLRIEYDTLVKEHPELAESLPKLPLKVFSGKASNHDGAQGVFFCYRIPRPDKNLIEDENGNLRWSDTAGYTVWLLHDLASQRVLTSPGQIAEVIRSYPDTQRKCILDKEELSGIRREMDKLLVKDHLRSLQAPIGVTPVLKCWMELN